MFALTRVAEQLSVSQCADHDGTGSGDEAGAQGYAKVSPKQWKVQMRSLMHELFGVDLMRVAGVGFEATLTLLSEVGSDFSAFPSAGQFSQWLGLAPGTNISGGKRLTGAKARGCQASGQAMRMSAVTLRATAANSVQHTDRAAQEWTHRAQSRPPPISSRASSSQW